MRFIDLLLGTVDLKITEESLTTFLNSLYDKWYKKDRLRHVTSSHSNYPHLKITGDCAVCKLFFFDDYGNEYRYTLDGAYDSESKTIHLKSINPGEHLEMDVSDVKVIKRQLLKLTSLGYGQGIFISEDGYPSRLSAGKEASTRMLLQQLYDAIPVSDRSAIDPTFNWLSHILAKS